MRDQIGFALVALCFAFCGDAHALTAKKSAPVAVPNAAEALRAKELELLKVLRAPNQTGTDLLDAAKKLYRLRAGRELCTYAGDVTAKKNECENQLLQIYEQATPQGKNLMNLCETAPTREAKMECTGKYDEITIDLKSMNDEPDGISDNARKIERTPEQLESFVSSNLAFRLKDLSEKFVHTGSNPSSASEPTGQH